MFQVRPERLVVKVQPFQLRFWKSFPLELVTFVYPQSIVQTINYNTFILLLTDCFPEMKISALPSKTTELHSDSLFGDTNRKFEHTSRHTTERIMETKDLTQVWSAYSPLKHIFGVRNVLRKPQKLRQKDWTWSIRLILLSYHLSPIGECRENKHLCMQRGFALLDKFSPFLWPFGHQSKILNSSHNCTALPTD